MKHEGFLEDPRTWVALSFVLFLIGFIRYAVPAIAKALDGRAEKIRSELEQASRLRAEAETVLASYKAKEQEVLAEAKALLDHARTEADALRIRAEEEMREAINRRMAQANENIASAEADAMATIRDNIVDIALAAARKMMVEQLESQGEDPAVAKALKDIERIVH